MRLSEFMSEHDLKDEDMAQRLGCDRSYVLKLRNGVAKPSATMMGTIAEKTGGSVQPNDWFENLPEADAA